MTIDPSTIKPGDTVRVSYQNAAMAANGIAPYEYTTIVYDGLSQGDVSAGADRIGDPALTILEHTPARPDWADAHVIRSIGEGETCYYVQRRPGSGRRSSGGIFNGADGYPVSWKTLAGFGYEITVVLDGDGNPPEPEHEWLDADALGELPAGTAVVTKHGRSCISIYGGVYWYMPKSGRPDLLHRSSEIAPARVLWTPEDES